MKLTRYSGAGNTFFIIDNRQTTFDIQRVQQLCEYGCVDGIILAEEETGFDARMRIFNADGSEAEMCGNGLRCFILFLKEIGIERSNYHIATRSGPHNGYFVDNEICVHFPAPKQLSLFITPNMHFIHTGVPHAVLFVDEEEEIDVESQGKDIRFSSLFAPEGANVNFVTLLQEGILKNRTFERGVEAETQACGTGAVAAALVTHKLYNYPSPITVRVPSKEQLKVSFSKDFSSISLQGPAIRCIETLELKDHSLIMSSL